MPLTAATLVSERLARSSRRTYENQQGTQCVTVECRDCRQCIAEHIRTFLAATIADVEPDHLRGKAIEKTALPKIIVLRDDDETVCRRASPNIFVRGGLQSQIAHVRGIRKNVRVIADQART